MNTRFKYRPEGSNWGDFGPDDQLGRLNLIGPEQVRKGVAEVKAGRTFCLSLPLNLPGGTVISPVRFPPRREPVIRQGGPYYNYEWRNAHEGATDIASDDCVTLYNQYSTQWDALCHRGALFDADGDGIPEPHYYNGFKAGEHLVRHPDGTVEAKALGIENMAAHGVQGRGVLVDLHSIYGNTRHEVGYDDLMRAMEAQQVEVEAGDIFCFWSGLDKMILSMRGNPDPSVKTACAVLDGHDEKLLQWIEDSGIAAIASDTIAVEAVGAKPAITNQEPGTNNQEQRTSLLPLHDRCLFRLGIHLGELWHLAGLAAWLRDNKRNRFLLTAPPLRLPGAVGSPVTPIATV
jgi:kynurenine formamidase